MLDGDYIAFFWYSSCSFSVDLKFLEISLKNTKIFKNTSSVRKSQASTITSTSSVLVLNTLQVSNSLKWMKLGLWSRQSRGPCHSGPQNT